MTGKWFPAAALAVFATAAHAEVQLSAVGENLRLKVSDDGCGFDTAAEALQASLGLIAMRERARLLNGNFSVTSSIGSGTLIEAVLPWADTADGVR